MSISDSQLPQQHPAFNLTSIMLAIPNRNFSYAESRCYIQATPNEILGEIFEWLRHLPRVKIRPLNNGEPPIPTMISPMVVSHVCSRWRRVALGISSQWNYLELNSTRHPEVFTSLLARSHHNFFSLWISLPNLNIKYCSNEQQVEFRSTFRALKANVRRLRSLHMRSNNATFFLVFNKFLNIYLPALRDLHLEQVERDAPRNHLGPLTFNPEVFESMHLENIMIECEAKCFAGLRVLHLINSSGTLLDQTQLEHSTYPLVPDGPAMMRLFELKIDNTNIIPTLPDSKPSFSHTTLRSLILANIRMPSDESVLNRLFQMTYSPLLEYLALENLAPPVFNAFLLRLNTPYPKYVRVRCLSLTKINLSGVDISFMRAFTNVVVLNLISVTETQRLFGYLLDPALMPGLVNIRIDNSLHRRITVPPPPEVKPPAPIPQA
ncbi:hypothetical protein H0H81_006801 [Sphagnurus paluster]|uniref:F-box domain-containing protein n=1 Tax=Sphagnurus paluster TaxID=117069 RepID=A0A9P7GRP6_9AGAR|nr:hypothetical protein H0H81_006801 [Sphagnurus paluster]